jgi:hypothetical protein
MKQRTSETDWHIYCLTELNMSKHRVKTLRKVDRRANDYAETMKRLNDKKAKGYHKPGSQNTHRKQG